jgi:hypothetical protein
MDREPDEMQLLGVGGICNEAYKIFRSYTRLLLSLACTLVLPLGIVIFSHSLISDPLMHKIFRNEERLAREQAGSPAAARTESRLDAEFFGLGVITVLYVVFLLAFSLLSTAAIVYSVASIYTGKGLSYLKVISVVPKVWKRLVYTFLWAHLLIFLYYVAFAVILLVLFTIQAATGITVLPIVVPVWIAFDALLIYFNLVWHLASVVSVLEESYGIGALKKSAHLIKGKRLVGFCLFSIYVISVVFVLSLFRGLVSHHHHMHSMFGRVIVGSLLLVLWTAVTLMGILVQSVLYFVCKSHHNESIDRYALSEHLDGYLGEYMPLKGPVSLEALEAELEEI